MYSKYDNDFKNEVLSLGIDKIYNRRKKELYLKHNESESDFLKYYNFLTDSKANPYTDCAIRFNYSQYMKAKKVREKITDLVESGSAYFVTLTFDNPSLEKTSVQTRRRYVARFLKDVCSKYVANIDYGKTNGREHYHAVVNEDLSSLAKWDCGFIDCEKIGSSKKYKEKSGDDNLKAISKYITKLTRHALKQKALNIRLIYSRN